MATAAPRGVRKVSELITQKGRTLIFTEDEAENLLWSDIPDGSLKINPTTGLMSVKLEGESGWVPAGIKNDGTLSIAKDTRLITEVYTITSLKDDDGNFVCMNEAGELRHYPYDDNGYMIFYLEKGSYQMLRNQISIVVDNCLNRTVANKEIEEVSETRVRLKEVLEVGQSIAIIYSNVVRIGNPYPRVFINDNVPDNAEIGDVWYDTDDVIGDDPNYIEDPDRSKEVDWSQIVGKPTTVNGYGITNELASASHKHAIDDITDFPITMRANGGNADTVANRKPGNSIGDIPYINSTGKLNSDIIPVIPSKTLTITQPDGTSNSYDGSVDVTIDLHEAVSSSVFNSRGELVFPNGNRFWLQ